MDKLQLSDSVDIISPKKRLRVEDSEDETDSFAEKWQSSFKRSRMVKQDDGEIISDKSNIDNDVKEEYNIKDEKYTEICPENEQMVQKISLSESDMDKKNKEKRDSKLRRENINENFLNDNNVAPNNSFEEINVKKEIVENEDGLFQKSTNLRTSIVQNKKITGDNEIIKEEIDKMVGGKEDGKKDVTKKCTMDIEVVDGLELSVECASDKDESSSESENEKNIKSRPRTIIVKAEPNESELDCSSDKEKSDSLIDTLDIKLEKSRIKKRSSRTSFNKLKVSGSEDSQNSNSDEDYSPRTKKKMKKLSPTTRKSTNKHRWVELKKGRGRDAKENSHKKNIEYEDEDTHAIAVEGAVNTTKTKNGMKEELSEKESSSKDESDKNSEREERSMKGRRKRRNNVKSQDRHILALKKYLNIAGVKVKSYNDIWADCKSNAAKIKRLKELLEKNGVNGRPTLVKCKRVREKNEKMKEVSELDTSNIISEGRVTRARRNMENNKKTKLPDTPPQHREARNTFRRIQTVVDSDSE